MFSGTGIVRGVEQSRMSANKIADFCFRFRKRSAAYRMAKIVTMIIGRNTQILLNNSDI